MALRDTNWITEAHFIQTSKESRQENITISDGVTSVTYEAIRTVVEGEWVVLTEAAANAYIAAHKDTANTSFTASEVNRYNGAWKLSRNVDSRT